MVRDNIRYYGNNSDYLWLAKEDENKDMEEMEMNEEDNSVPLWDELKTQLDQELVPDQVEQVMHSK